MTKIEFAKGMAFLGACLDRDIPTPTVEAWFMVLGDLEVRQFERAIVSVVRNHRFSGLPPVGMILQAAGVADGLVDSDATALLAWDRVLKAIREVGAYRSVQWDDPAIPAAIEVAAGSWPLLCELQSDELHKWTQKKFVDAYRAHRAARTGGDGITTGLLAADAGRLGFEAPEPMRLTDELSRVYGFGRADHPKALPAPLNVIPALPSPESVEPTEEFEVRRERLKRELSERYPELEAASEPASVN